MKNNGFARRVNSLRGVNYAQVTRADYLILFTYYINIFNAVRSAISPTAAGFLLLIYYYCYYPGMKWVDVNNGWNINTSTNNIVTTAVSV